MVAHGWSNVLHHDLGTARTIRHTGYFPFTATTTPPGISANIKTTTFPLISKTAWWCCATTFLNSGRSVRGALNELFEFGRPANVCSQSSMIAADANTDRCANHGRRRRIRPPTSWFWSATHPTASVSAFPTMDPTESFPRSFYDRSKTHQPTPRTVG